MGEWACHHSAHSLDMSFLFSLAFWRLGVSVMGSIGRVADFDCGVKHSVGEC